MQCLRSCTALRQQLSHDIYVLLQGRVIVQLLRVAYEMEVGSEQGDSCCATAEGRNEMEVGDVDGNRCWGTPSGKKRTRPTIRDLADAALGEGQQTSMGVAQPEGSRLARGMAERGGAGLMGAQHARQATIAGHANYCKTEVVVGELPSGCVDMSSKPDRCDSKYEAGEAGDTAWQADLRVWEKRNIAGQVRQQRAEAAYEHTAGRISAWLREQGHPAFAEWVRGVDGLASLRLVTMDNGCPCPPTVEHVLDWAFSFAN